MTTEECVGRADRLLERCLCGSSVSMQHLIVSSEDGGHPCFVWEIFCPTCGLRIRYPDTQLESRENAMQAWHRAIHPEDKPPKAKLKEKHTMTSSEFEQAAKKAVADYMENVIRVINNMPAVDAIPVEWLEEHDSEGNEYGRRYITVVEALSMWQKEQKVER